MTTTQVDAALDAGIDGIAVKPTECDLSASAERSPDTLVVDYEGAEYVPDPATLRALDAGVRELRVTVPVRADGFDPLGDDGRYDDVPAAAKLVLVAGHPAYLSGRERRRSVRPRLEAAVRRANDPWVGTDGVERAARETGATQFLLLSPTTEDELRDLRQAGIGGDLAVYAPTVLADDLDAVLDAVGPYVARRRSVERALPAGTTTDSGAAGRARGVLRDACDDFALVGAPGAVATRVEALRAAGADLVVGYPAGGLDEFAPS